LQETVEQENSIKHRVTKEDVRNSIKEYLGDYANILRDITLEEYEAFTNIFPKVNKGAYFVKGTEELLRKFKAYFIAKCVMQRYDYASIMLRDYIEGITNHNDNELFVAGVSKELLFLYLHGEISGIGNTDNWLGSTTLDRMVNRKREGLITVLLSERSFPIIENSKEIIVFNLGGAKKAILTEGLKEKTANSNNHTVYD
jgi:hypothetical protein